MEPYQIFLDSIKSPETLRRYKNNLQSFLILVPQELYKKTLGKIPEDKKPATLANLFVEFSKKDPDLASHVIAAFIKNKKKLVQEGKLSSQTIPNHLKPIKALLDSNGIPIHWKSLTKILPRRESSSNDRAYTKAELQKMMEVAHDITDKTIILLFSSGGFRLESWNYFTWKDYITFKAKDGSFKGGALLVYRGDPESYWTFITPEACKMLGLYREQWKSEIGEYPKPNDPLIKTVRFPVVRRLNAKGVRKRIEKIVTKIGLRPPLPAGKKRHEVQLDHGFRKYFNTMMRRAKVNYLDKEDMMGHKVGLERHYERYQEEDFERFPEYQKAIPFLTISDEERLRIENQQKQKDLDDLEENSTTFQEITKRLDAVENGPVVRRSYFTDQRLQIDDSPRQKIILTAIQLWFEMRASESEKKIIWKKIKEAIKSGKEIDPEIFGESAMSLQNLPSPSDYDI